MSATTRTFSKEQQQYIVAKAVYEETCTQVSEEMARIYEASPAIATDEQIDAFCDQEEAIHLQYHLFQITQQLRAAETDLIAWGIARLAQEPGVTEQQMLDIMNVATTPYLHYRQKAIDLFMRLA